MKPENILVDKSGHLKLTDFGFSKFLFDRTWTMCGTPEYLAPEIISGHGHTKAVDWWSLGILIYEMLAGYPPFNDENKLRLFSRISEPEKMTFPDFFTPDSIDLIRKLLVTDPSRRLGVMCRGVIDIKLHPFFSGINWSGVAERKNPAPFKPKLKNCEDTSNFTDGIEELESPYHEIPFEENCPVPPSVNQIFDSF
uniref:Protein kinase domain-containing protein n=1 Tax=Arcella intermedia TaxID=1963864 RepID=A0A6B2LJU5_9EUKA